MRQVPHPGFVAVDADDRQPGRVQCSGGGLAEPATSAGNDCYSGAHGSGVR
jgi:hypothetical protein